MSLQRHYAKSATEFCDFSEKFNCDIVNRSEYSSFEGIPVAGIGVLGYATLFVLSTFSKSRAETPNRLLAACDCRIMLSLVSDLHRSPRTEDVVHLMPELPRH